MVNAVGRKKYCRSARRFLHTATHALKHNKNITLFFFLAEYYQVVSEAEICLNYVFEWERFSIDFARSSLSPTWVISDP